MVELKVTGIDRTVLTAVLELLEEHHGVETQVEKKQLTPIYHVEFVGSGEEKAVEEFKGFCSKVGAMAEER